MSLLAGGEELSRVLLLFADPFQGSTTLESYVACYNILSSPQLGSVAYAHTENSDQLVSHSIPNPPSCSLLCRSFLPCTVSMVFRATDVPATTEVLATCPGVHRKMELLLSKPAPLLGPPMLLHSYSHAASLNTMVRGTLM